MTSAAEHNEMVDWIMKLRNSTGTFEAFKEKLASLSDRFPNASPDDARKVLEDVISRGNEDQLVRHAERDQEIALTERIIDLLAGFSEDITLEHAVKIRAAEGHPFALWLLDHPEVLNKEILVPLD
jgi:hypothetical protein